MNQTDSHGEVLSLVISCIDFEAQFIEMAFRQSEEFQSLCHDYMDCRKALKGWKLSKSGLADRRHQEYAKLLNELDIEIRTWLKTLRCETDQHPVNN